MVNQSIHQPVIYSKDHARHHPCDIIQYNLSISKDRVGQSDGAIGTETSPQPQGCNSQHHHLPCCILPSPPLSPTISPAESHHLPFWVPPSPLLSPTISPTESHHLPYWVLSSKLFLLPVPFSQTGTPADPVYAIYSIYSCMSSTLHSCDLAYGHGHWTWYTHVKPDWDYMVTSK